jgi:hypothetical protein
MNASLAQADLATIGAGVVLIVGGLACLPVYWWLFITPIITLAKKIRKSSRIHVL